MPNCQCHPFQHPSKKLGDDDRHGPERDSHDISGGELLAHCETAFDTILNESPVIIIQMRVNTCFPESVPRVISHLETWITDTSFIQNNIKSGSSGMCSSIRQKSAYAHTVLQSNTSPIFHKEQFYIIRVHSLILQIQHRWVSNFTYKPWVHESHI